MDRCLLGVNMNGKKRGVRRSNNKAIKVVYISTPMKVKTSASEFRALVQELTGKDSDTARFDSDATKFTDVSENSVDDHDQGLDDPERVVGVNDDHMLTWMNSFFNHQLEESTTSSDSGLDFPAVEGGFMKMLQSNLFQEPSQIV